MSDDPQGIELSGRPAVTKMSKKPLYVVAVMLLILAAALVWSVNFAHNPKEKEEQKKVEVPTETRPLLPSDASGLSLPQPESSGLASVPQENDEPLIVVQKAEPPRDTEGEDLRRRKRDAYFVALASPMTTVKRGSTEREQADAGTREKKQAAAVDAAGNPENQADLDKENFMNRVSREDDWQLPYSRKAGAGLEIKTGTVIPGVMLTGINSDLPGSIIAQVSQNVFDTATGRHLLIPQGARLFGAYDSRIVYGQRRVLVAWNRVVFPDGSAVTLGAMPGTDMAGYAGYEDKVDNHYLRIFGSAVMMALITGGMSYSVDKLTPDNDNDKITAQGELGTALASQLGQATTRLLERNINIKPTLEIRPGYQFNIVATKDITFEQPYTAWR